VSTPLGEPHDFPDTTEPGVFTGTDPKADVGEPNDLGAQDGFAHTGVDPVEPQVFTGTDPDSDVGIPNGVT
jgi:hypothetical protein